MVKTIERDKEIGDSNVSPKLTIVFNIIKQFGVSDIFFYT